VSYLDGRDLDLLGRHDCGPVAALARSSLSPLTSSAGRLFDAVAALLGVRDRVNYEGQAAIELEQLADLAERGRYVATVEDGVVHGVDLVRAVVDDLRAGVAPPVIAARFHNGVAGSVVTVCESVRGSTGLDTVALSGGVFQNLLLLERTVDGLTARRFTVLTHHRVPPNDGGISLGQAVVAASADPG
jgi:hydrogenase maturation protein HypF